MTVEEILDKLGKISFFSEFAEDEKRKILKAGDCFVEYGEGDCIIAKGSTDSSMFFVLGGTVALTGGEDLDNEITELKYGALFGDVPFVKSPPRLTSVIAKEAAQVLRLDKETIKNLDPVIQGKFKDQFLKLLIFRLDMLKSAVNQNQVDFDKFLNSFQNIIEEIEIIKDDSLRKSE